MTQIPLSDSTHDDEVLRFWTLQANQLLAASEALQRYLDSPASSPSFKEQ
ncbi:hypothetical protein [Halomonas sp. A29]